MMIMITSTMTRTNKRTKRGSAVDAHRSSTQCWPQRGIVTSLDEVADQTGQRIEHAEADSGLARRRGNRQTTVLEGLNYISERRVI